MRSRRLIGGVIAASTLALATGCAAPPDNGKSFASIGITGAEWSVPLPGEIAGVRAGQVVGNAVVVAFERGVLVLDRDTGRKRWSDTDIDYVIAATDETVVTLTDGPYKTATGYDVATGEERFSKTYEGDAEAFAVTGDLLLGAECQDDADACELVATDLRSGREAWSGRYPFHSSVRLEVDATPTEVWETSTNSVEPLRPPDRHVVALRTLSAGNDDSWRTTLLDTRTGRPIGTPVTTPETSPPVLVSDEVYLRWNRSTSPCRPTVTGYDVRTHRKLWKRTMTDPEGECLNAWKPDVVGNSLLTYDDDTPTLVDLSTGKATWTGKPSMRPIGVSDGVVVQRFRSEHKLVAVDTKTSEQLWSDAYHEKGFTYGRGVVAGGHYVLPGAGTKDRRLLWTYDVRTGDRSVCEGSNQLIGIGDGWLLGGLDPDSEAPVDARYELRYFRL